MTHPIHIDSDSCIACGLCVDDCLDHNIEIQEDTAVILRDECLFCGHCVAICPQNSVTMDGYPEAPMPLEKGRGLDPDDLLYAIKARRTIRQFKDQAIPKDTIAHIIEAGRFTPTAKNVQGIEYIVLDQDIRAIEDIAVAYFRKLTARKPMIGRDGKPREINDDFFFFGGDKAILICADRADDANLAATSMAMMAEALGLGVLVCGYFTRASQGSKDLQEALSLSKAKPVQCTLVLGYPAVRYQRSAQRNPAHVTWR